MQEQLICITCPMGCHLSIERKVDGNLAVTGNRCPRGIKYAEEELLSPKRVVTATCRSAGIRVPCRTDKAFPKENVDALLKEIYALEVRLPVKSGDILIEKALGLNVKVIATRSVK